MSGIVAYGAYIPYFRRHYPASTLVEVKRLVKPDYLIEIDAVAVIPADRVKRTS